MTGQRRRLVLLCLSLLSLSSPKLRAQAPAQPPLDLLAVWRSCSPSARQTAADGALDGRLVSPTSQVPSPRLAVGSFGLALDADTLPSPGTAESSAAAWNLPDRKPRKLSQKSEGLLGSLSAQVEVTESPAGSVWDEPAWKRNWQTNEAWQLGLAGTVSLFGQVGANSDEAAETNMKVSGRTGLACKLPVGWLGDVTLRSGPGVSYTDPLRPVRTQGRSDWLVEVQARWPLLFGIGLEYQGSAQPSLTPLAQDLFNQDVRLAVPLGGGGKLRLGAKRQWTGMLDPRAATASWTDSMQLYLGLELNR